MHYRVGLRLHVLNHTVEEEVGLAVVRVKTLEVNPASPGIKENVCRPYVHREAFRLLDVADLPDNELRTLRIELLPLHLVHLAQLVLNHLLLGKELVPLVLKHRIVIHHFPSNTSFSSAEKTDGSSSFCRA